MNRPPLAARLLRALVRDALALIGHHGDHRICNWPNTTHIPLNEDDQ